MGNQTSGSEEMSIEVGSEKDLLPLLVKETVEKVSALDSGKTNPGSKVTILLVDSYLQKGGVFDLSSRSLVFDGVNLG